MKLLDWSVLWPAAPDGPLLVAGENGARYDPRMDSFSDK